MKTESQRQAGSYMLNERKVAVPEILKDKKVFSLLEVTLSVKKTISDRYQSSFWVKAEMNKLNHYSYSGHCYPELLEKNNGRIVAQMRANLWKDDFQRINENFLTALKEPLKDGISILFNATVSFDPVHGFSLRIIDIDPVFSLGELEKEKLETIMRLKNEGIFLQNKTLQIPALPQRIAIISVETSKGLADFLKVIDHNAWGYKFFNFLFPAILQGDRSVESILFQLKRVKKVKKHFDIVVIIRGGGGDVGLSSYNNYTLAREIALFPIPVLTGIGHSTNETVSEMIAFKNAITPTELADYLLQKLHNFSVPVQKAEEVITKLSYRLLRDENLRFTNTIRYFKSVTNNLISANHHEIKSVTKKLSQQVEFMLNNEKKYAMESINSLSRSLSSFVSGQRTLLTNIEKHVSILDPVRVIQRGFTVTLRNGKAITSFAEIKEGDVITTVTVDGTIVSKVISSKKSEEL